MNEEQQYQQPEPGDRSWMVREIDAKNRRRQRGIQRFFYAPSSEAAEAKFIAVQAPLYGNILVSRPEREIWDGQKWLRYSKRVAERFKAKEPDAP